MLFQLLAGALAGLGIFFLGMHIASENVRDLITPRLQETMIRWTRRDFFGGLWGGIIGFITQETSVVTFILANLCSNKFISLRRALPIINWNNPGGCILVYFVFFNIDSFIMIAVGFLSTLVMLQFFSRYQTHIKFFLGICLLLYGLIIINEGMTKIIELSSIKEGLIQVIEFSGITIFIIGAVVSFFAQAFIVYVLTAQFVYAGIMDLDQAFIMVSGAHIGLALNTYLLFATFKGIARQVMLAQVLFDFLTGIFVLVLYFAQTLSGSAFIKNALAVFSDQFSFQIVTLILLANLIVALLLSFLAELELVILAKFSKTTEKEANVLEEPKYVTAHLIINPSSAALLYFKEYVSIVDYLVKYLELARRAMENNGETFSLDTYHKKFNILFAKIKKVLLDLICNSTAPEVVKELNWVSQSLELLIQLEENLYIKSSFLSKAQANHEFSQKADGYIRNLIEAEEVLLLVLRDVLMEPHKENIAQLELFTQSRAELKNEMEKKFFILSEQKNEENASQAMFLTTLYERDSALIHQFVEYLKVEFTQPIMDKVLV